MRAFTSEINEQRLLEKAKKFTDDLQRSKEDIGGLRLIDSPEFVDLKITSLSADGTLGNIAKSVKSYLTQLWAKLTTHTGLTTTAHGGIIANDDSRLSDARTPTAHVSTHHTSGSDALTPSDIGAASSSDLAAKQDALGSYNVGAPSATGYITVTIGGATYKILVSNI